MKPVKLFKKKKKKKPKTSAAPGERNLMSISYFVSNKKWSLFNQKDEATKEISLCLSDKKKTKNKKRSFFLSFPLFFFFFLAVHALTQKLIKKQKTQLFFKKADLIHHFMLLGKCE